MKDLAKRFRFGTKEHEGLSQKLHSRLKKSQDDLSSAHARMAKNEEQYRAYLPEKEADKLRRQERESKGVPQYTTIEIPYSYAQILAMHTYITSVFLSRDPIFQYAGVHGESQTQEQSVEALIAYQIMSGGNLPQLFIWTLDPGKYGYGVIGHYWENETIRVRTRQERQVKAFGIIPVAGKTEMVDVVQDVPGYTGNRLYNVRPQDWFPDTRVPLLQFQKGEFVGRYVEISMLEYREGVAVGKYFNEEEVQKRRSPNESNRDGGDLTRNPGSSAVSNLPNTNGSSNIYGEKKDDNFILKGHEVYVRLRPREWGLAEETGYEIWCFTRLTDGLIIRAEPTGNLHGKFPFDILEDEVEGYNLTAKSSLEVMKPLNDVMTWLVNTHFYNVRASLNNQFVVDPSMIVMRDLENPNPGGMYRLKPDAYGKDVRMAISQLPVADVTGNHINDMSNIAEMIQRATGISDNIMGMVNAGGRKTATEVRTSSSFGVNRMKTKAEYYSAVGFTPLAQKLLANSQQYYSIERKFRIVGDLAQYSPGFVNVTPETIAGFYDFVPVDGTLPIDRFAQANLWQALFGQMRNFPQIMMTYDIAKIFGWVAGLAGIKNISQFKIQVVPDGQMMQNAQMGNSIPMGGPASAGKQDLTAMNEPGQLPGMGKTG